ncbi:MAG TPA: hypothetical protein VFV07_01980 [Rhizomicrobium sp.]|nr:hypothetical protein [Rhizomicrobium sp.]
MSDNRKQILEMLGQGRITADEAERLLAALEGSGQAGPAQAAAAPAPKYLRVQIDADDAKGGEVRTKMNIRVPLQLLRAGVKLASILPPDAREQMNEALHEKGVGLDINQIKPENLDELIENLRDVSIDIAGRRGRTATIKVFSE